MYTTPAPTARALCFKRGLLDLASFGDVIEPRKFAAPRQVRSPSWTVTVLSDNDLGVRFHVIRHVAVDLGAVQEQHNVGVLLQRSRLTKVGHHWTLIGALFKFSRELRQRDYRTFELSRQDLERTAHLRDFDLAVLGTTTRAHQLQIVNNHDAEVAVLLFNASSASAHVHDRQTWVVVNEDFRGLQVTKRLVRAA